MKTFSLGMKIGLGFLVVLVLTLVVGVAGYLALGTVLEKTALNQESNVAKSLFSDVRGSVVQFFLDSYHEGRQKQDDARRDALASLERCRRALVDIRSRSGLAPDVRHRLDQVASQLDDYATAFDRIVTAETGKIDAVPPIMASLDEVRALYEKGAFLVEEIIPAYGIFHASVQGYFERNTATRWEEVAQARDRTRTAIVAWNEMVRNSDSLAEIGKAMVNAFDTIEQKLLTYNEDFNRQTADQARMQTIQASLWEGLSAVEAHATEQMSKIKRLSISVIAGSVVTAVVLGIFSAILSTRAIVGPIKME